MLTNILATVTVCLVTNVTDKFPQQLVPDFQPNLNGFSDCVYRGHFENVANATEKDVVTEVKSVKTIQFDLDDQHYQAVTEQVISSKTEHFKLNTTWTKQP